MADTTVGVAEVELADQDSFSWKIMSEGNNKMDRPEQAKSVNHVRVMIHVAPFVDGRISLGHAVRHVVGESVFQDAFTGFRQAKLTCNSHGLDHRVRNLLDELDPHWHRKPKFYISVYFFL